MARKVDIELAEVLGESPPSGLRVVKAADMLHLIGAVQLAVERQEHAMAEAEEQALRHLPWPLRGTVRRILGGEH